MAITEVTRPVSIVYRMSLVTTFEVCVKWALAWARLNYSKRLNAGKQNYGLLTMTTNAMVISASHAALPTTQIYI